MRKTKKGCWPSSSRGREEKYVSPIFRVLLTALVPTNYCMELMELIFYIKVTQVTLITFQLHESTVKNLQICFTTVICFNMLHVSAQKGHYWVLHKFKNKKSGVL